MQLNWLLSAQALSMPLPLNRYYIYLPYGPVFKKGIDESEAQEALAALCTAIKTQYPKSLFIRIEPTSSPLLKLPGRKSVNIQPGNTLVTDITQSQEDLLAQMHPKTRCMGFV
jgi:lipid II:glycine glycyltransferase (peptidoglycan interpeptide bridge formation enzyme)